MIKRTIQLGDYDTAVHGLWTLAAWSFPEPPVAQNLVDIPGRYKGPLDLSTALTDGVPTYGARSLSITLESSEGDRLAREERIAAMVNRLHGQRVDFVLPDRPRYYGTGRLSIETLYNDMAHASVQVTGVCEPWLYAKDESVVRLQASSAVQTAQVRNAGAMPVLPLLTITGTGVSFMLQFGVNTWTLGAGVYELPALLLTAGTHVLTYSGSGAAEIRYREAVLK